jgi:hypothetical protein
MVKPLTKNAAPNYSNPPKMAINDITIPLLAVGSGMIWFSRTKSASVQIQHTE